MVRGSPWNERWPADAECFITRDLPSAAVHISHSGVKETDISCQEWYMKFSDLLSLYACLENFICIGLHMWFCKSFFINCLTDVIFALMGPQSKDDIKCPESLQRCFAVHWIMPVFLLVPACLHESSMIYHSGPELGLFSSRIRYQIAPVHSQCIYPCLDIKQT